MPTRSTATLILLPGLDGTSEPRMEFIRLLAPRIAAEVIAYPLDVPLRYAELEAWIRERLPHDRPYILLGESFSGPLAIRIGAVPPPGLLGIVLCSTFARSPYPHLKFLRRVLAWVPLKSMPRWLRGRVMWSSTDIPPARRNSERALSKVAGRVLRRRVFDLLGVDTTSALARITLPMLIVHARADRTLPAAATRWLLEHAPRAAVAPVDGPHLLLQSRAQECAVIIGKFVCGFAVAAG